ncbi:hypothetical protein ACLB2K_045327 [Fragaria x ananassa]
MPHTFESMLTPPGLSPHYGLPLHGLLPPGLPSPSGMSRPRPPPSGLPASGLLPAGLPSSICLALPGLSPPRLPSPGLAASRLAVGGSLAAGLTVPKLPPRAHIRKETYTSVKEANNCHVNDGRDKHNNVHALLNFLRLKMVRATCCVVARRGCRCRLHMDHISAVGERNRAETP